MTTDVEKLLELARKATPGPWVGDRYDGTVKYTIISRPTGSTVMRSNYDPDCLYGFQKSEDDDYCLAANPATIIDLCEELLLLRQNLREVRDEIRARIAELKGE